MYKKEIINTLRDALIAEFEESYVPSNIHFGEGNILNVARIVPLPYMSSQCIQLADGGTTIIEGYEGGTWIRSFVVDIGIYVGVEYGTDNEFAAAVSLAQDIEQIVLRVAHWFDDEDIMSDLGKVVGVSSSQIVQSNGKQFIVYTMQVILKSALMGHDDFKEFNSGTGTVTT